MNRTEALRRLNEFEGKLPMRCKNNKTREEIEVSSVYASVIGNNKINRDNISINENDNILIGDGQENDSYEICLVIEGDSISLTVTIDDFDQNYSKA